MKRRTRNAMAAWLLITASGQCLAALEASPGNVAQPECEVSRTSSLYQIGTVIGGGGTAIVKDKKSGVGKTLKSGDLVYYVSLIEGVKYYSTEKQIEIIDKSPLTPDTAVVPGTKYQVSGTFFNKAGRKFDLIRVGSGFNSFYVMVDDTGSICSSRLNDKLVFVGMPVVYQGIPLQSVTEESPVANPRNTSIAVTLKEFDAATFSLDIAILVNGRVQTRKTMSYDLFAGSAKIGDMEITVSKTQNGLVVTSLEEPADYNAWMKNVFK